MPILRLTSDDGLGKVHSDKCVQTVKTGLKTPKKHCRARLADGANLPNPSKNAKSLMIRYIP
jgi:hypothetical protein